jgi:glucan phosphoethanolaminetransferase (alkaline phosphatase superfamily)
VKRKIKTLLKEFFKPIKPLMNIKLSRFNIALISSLIFFIIFNSKLFLNRITNPDASILATLAEPFIVTFVLLVVFFIFAQIKILYRIFAVTLFFLSAIAGYFIIFMNIVLDQPMMVTIFATDSGETSELISSSMIIKILALAIIPVLFALFIKFKPRDFSFKAFKKILVTLCILTITPLTLNNEIYEKDKLKIISSSYLPFNYIDATNRYFRKTRKSLQVVEGKVNIYEANDFVIEEGNDDLVVVVVIGESARRQNFSINGYTRRTNPKLESLDNIVTYQTTTSCSRFTQYSVPCIMTRQTKSEFKFPMMETSMISIFKGLEFDTHWHDIQGAFSSNAMPIFQIASEAHDKIFRGNLRAKLPSDSKLLDEHLLPILDQSLKNDIVGKRKFIVLHSAGSHYDYDDRYPDSFKKFQPTCDGRGVENCTKQEITNSYDNSVLYTDYFLNEIITRLKGKNAIMLYVADHSESLGEDGVFLHGTDTHSNRPEQFEIPLIFWASEKFLSSENNKHKFNNMKFNAMMKSPTSHDNVFHSILDCSGISSSIIKRGKSLCINPGLFEK